MIDLADFDFSKKLRRGRPKEDYRRLLRWRGIAAYFYRCLYQWRTGEALAIRKTEESCNVSASTVRNVVKYFDDSTYEGLSRIMRDSILSFEYQQAKLIGNILDDYERKGRRPPPWLADYMEPR